MIVKSARVELRLVSAAQSYGEVWEAASLTLMGIRAGSHGRSLGERRRLAAIELSVAMRHPITEETFRRSWEQRILRDIAVELVRANAND